MLDEWFRQKLNRRKENDLLRHLSIDTQGADFSSNDYLGLARSKELHGRIIDELEKYPFNGATGSRLLTGHSKLHRDLETYLSQLFDAENCLVYASGYMANLGVLGAVPQRGDTIIYDELCHASIKEGLRLSQADHLRFKHNDAEDLERLLKKASGRKFVVMEALYSMDGDICDFESIIPVIKQNEAYSMVDEAHSTGVYGENGNGLLNELSLSDQVDIRVYTFGKAMGIHGACVAGSKNLIEYLINFSRPFIYTTAVPPAQLISIRESFQFLGLQENRTVDLRRNIELFLRNRYQSGITDRFLESFTAIQGISIPGNSICRQVAQRLRTSGFRVFPVLSPTVPEGKERIRICLHSYNSEDEIKSLIEKLEEYL